MSLWTRPEPHDEDGPQGAEWLGHRDNCSLQWSARCNCNDPAEICHHDWAEYWDGSGGYAATDCCHKCHAYRPTPPE